MCDRIRGWRRQKQQNFAVSHSNLSLINPVETPRRTQTKTNSRGRGKKARRMQVQADKKNRKFYVAVLVNFQLKLLTSLHFRIFNY